MKRLAGWALAAGVFLLAAILSELPWFKQASQAIDRRHDPLLGLAIALTAFGFIIFMGGILSLLIGSGEPMSHEEIEGAISQRRNAGEPAVWRASAHRVFGAAGGRQAANEASFAGMKEAWRSGDWIRDSQWRRVFIICSGAGLLFYGMFSLFVVIGAPPIKVLMAGAMAYATIMTIRGFARS